MFSRHHSLVSGNAFLTIMLASLLQSAAAAQGPPPLPALSIDPTGISISGLSSGADFVVQFQVAFSSLISGVGVFAGQPYHCAVTFFEGDELVPFCEGTHARNGSALPIPGSPRAGCTNDKPSPDVRTN